MNTIIRNPVNVSIYYINNFRPKPSTEEGYQRLFLTQDGKPITPNTIKLMFSRLAIKSGVSRLHCHLCRHTFAIDYLLNGGDIISLKEILGYSSIDIVNRYVSFNNAQIALQHSKFSPVDRLDIH